MTTMLYTMDMIFIFAGLSVWAVVVGQYRRNNLLAIRSGPSCEAIRFGGTAILAVLMLFLLASSLVYHILDFSPLSDEASQPILVDTFAKAIVGVVMIVLLRKSLFRFEAENDDEISPSPPLNLKQLIGYSFIIYLATYPLVNFALIHAGMFLTQYVLDLADPETHQAFEILGNPDSPIWVRINVIVLAAIISPIVEEIFFRGMLQNYFYKLTGRPMIAIMLAGALFAMVHIPLYHQMPALWMLGVILGWSYYRYRTLALPIAIHILFNSVALGFWFLGAEG